MLIVWLLIATLTTLDASTSDLEALYQELQALASVGHYDGEAQIPARQPLYIPEIEPYLLTAARNEFVPRGVTGPIQIDIQSQLVQIITAWQFMTFDMWAQSNTCINYIDPLRIEYGFYEPDEIHWFIDRLVTSLNQRDVKALSDLARDYPAYCTQNIGGGNASCGYQSLKNGLLISALGQVIPDERKNLLKNIVDVRFAITLFGLDDQGTELITGKKEMGPWRTWVINEIAAQTKILGMSVDNDSLGEWLSHAVLSNLAEHVSYTDLGLSTTISKPAIAIYAPSAGLMGNELISLLRKNKQQNGIFIVGTGAHWLALCVIRTAEHKTVYVIADSENESRYQDPLVIGLIRAITDVDITPKLGAVPVIDSLRKQYNLLSLGENMA